MYLRGKVFYLVYNTRLQSCVVCAREIISFQFLDGSVSVLLTFHCWEKIGQHVEGRVTLFGAYNSRGLGIHYCHGGEHGSRQTDMELVL